MQGFTEFEAIRAIAQIAQKSAIAGERRRSGRGTQKESKSGGGPIEVGIGDDAAVLKVGNQQLVVSVDAAVEGVHFRRDLLSAKDLGIKATQAALSDLAAMAAEPLACTASLILPPWVSKAYLLALVRGQVSVAEDLKVPLVGGNLAQGRELSITTTVLGTVRHALTRDSARPGDEIWLLGEVGLAALGLELLERGVGGGQKGSLGVLERTCIRAWRRPLALVALARSLENRAHALIDVSDGLGQDAGHVAEKSAVRLVLEEARIRACFRKGFDRLCREAGRDPLELCLAGGEDYALLATGPNELRPPQARPIGVVTKGKGVWLQTPAGRLKPIQTPGFDHFARASKRRFGG